MKFCDRFPKVRLPLWATLLSAVLLAGTALVNLPLLLFSLDEKKKAADQRGADRA